VGADGVVCVGRTLPEVEVAAMNWMDWGGIVDGRAAMRRQASEIEELEGGRWLALAGRRRAGGSRESLMRKRTVGGWGLIEFETD
jgi:hypothetical protein